MLHNLIKFKGAGQLLRPQCLKLDFSHLTVWNQKQQLHISSSLEAGEFRDLLSKPDHKRSGITSKFPGFEPVFISPHIKHIRAACRLKLYQTGFILILMPISVKLLAEEQILPQQVALTAGFCVGSLAVLGFVGEIFRKVVGILYLSEDKTKVIVSHNTFFGRRKDITLDVENIIPISDSAETVEDLVWKLQTYSGDPKYFFICTRYGGILSRKGFWEIVGEDAVGK